MTPCTSNGGSGLPKCLPFNCLSWPLGDSGEPRFYPSSDVPTIDYSNKEEKILLVGHIYPVQESQQPARFCSPTGRVFPRDYLACQRNLDAHDAEDLNDTCGYYTSLTSLSGAPPLGTAATILLKTSDILSEIRSQQSEGCRLPFQNHAAESAIKEVYITGLHGDRKHASIVELKFSTQHQFELFRTGASQAQQIVARFRGISDKQVTGSVICFNDGCISTSLKDVLLHMEVFYWRETYIEFEVALFEGDTCLRSSKDERRFSTTFLGCDDRRTSYPALSIPFAPTVPDDNRILSGHPSGLPLCGNLDQFGPPRVIEKEAHVITSEQNRFSINLDGRELYSIIKNQVVTLYRSKISVETRESILIPLTLLILPFKPGDKYMMMWAETANPIAAASEITIEATAFKPSKDRSSQYGRLGHPVRCSGSMREHTGQFLVLDKLVLQMHAFYCSEVSIDIKMSCN